MRLRTAMLAAAVAVLPGAACSKDDAPPPVDLVGDGARVSVSLDPFELRVLDPAGKEVLRTLTGGDDAPYGAPAATRDDGQDSVKLLPGWDGYVPIEHPWSHGASARLVARADTSASFELGAGAGAITIDVTLEGAKVRVHLAAHDSAPPETAWNKTTLAFALRPDEHFFGLGERFASVDHRGLSMYSWAEEGASSKGEHAPRADDNPFPNGPSMTYFPVPFVLSSAGYAMYFATTYRTETHLGSERPDAWRVAANTTELETVIYVHDDPLASLDDYTRDTGRPFVPARWVFGPRRRVSKDYVVDGVPEYQLLRTRKVPTTGLDDATHFLPHRGEVGQEDALRAWTATAHAWGYKVMAYNNPYVSMTDAAAGEDFAYGRDHGLFATTPDGAPGATSFISGKIQDVATIDLTNPEAVAWFQSMLKRTLALGYDGWMHDFGEYVRRPWRFADGRTGDAVHNQFPVLSAKAAHDLLVAERPDDFLFFVRSGYAGTQAYVPAVWSGDPEATFDETQGMPAMLRGGLNLAMSGVPLWGSDVTGYKCITDDPRDKEVYLRWAEVGAVSPIMMEQNACSNPIERREKWKLWNDDETVTVYGAMARLHTRLAPYFEVLAREANRTGVPIMRHPFLYYPHEPEAWAIEDSFFLGPSLYASPVVRRGVFVKDTWLPPGRWVDLDDMTVYEGGARVSIPAPLGKLPLLLRDGGIVPMLDPSIDTLAPATEASVVTPDKVADRLDVMVALAAGSEASITLADGTTLLARRAATGAAAGAPSGLPSVAPADVATCAGAPADAGCVAESAEGMVDRVRLTTPLAQSYDVKHGDLELHAAGPTARRVRWDVMRTR